MAAFLLCTSLCLAKGRTKEKKKRSYVHLCFVYTKCLFLQITTNSVICRHQQIFFVPSCCRFPVRSNICEHMHTAPVHVCNCTAATSDCHSLPCMHKLHWRSSTTHWGQFILHPIPLKPLAMMDAEPRPPLIVSKCCLRWLMKFKYFHFRCRTGTVHHSCLYPDLGR